MARPSKEANRAAQKRFRERVMADPDAWEAFKKKERRRQRLRYQQNASYAERKRAKHAARYVADPAFRERSAERNRTPENLARRRALQCLARNSATHLLKQLEILAERAKRLLLEIDET